MIHAGVVKRLGDEVLELISVLSVEIGGFARERVEVGTGRAPHKTTEVQREVSFSAERRRVDCDQMMSCAANSGIEIWPRGSLLTSRESRRDETRDV